MLPLPGAVFAWQDTIASIRQLFQLKMRIGDALARMKDALVEANAMLACLLGEPVDSRLVAVLETRGSGSRFFWPQASANVFLFCVQSITGGLQQLGPQLAVSA